MESFQFGRIIIEPHTYCNRSCDFCLIKYMDKAYKEKVFYMSDEILYKTLNTIYSNIHLFKQPLTISLFKYNEPLYDLDNFNKVKNIIKQYFRDRNIDTYLYIHTNGDYLNCNNFESVMNNLDQMIVNDYSDGGIKKSLEFFSKLNKSIKFQKIEYSSMNKKDKIYYNYKCKSIISYINSTSGMLKTTRGSVLQDYLDINSSGKWVNNAIKRDYDCDVIGRIFIVDYNGDVFPCCDTSSRITKHKDMCVGNILHDSIKNIIDNTKNINIYNKKACEYCHMGNLNCSYIDDNLRYY